MTKGKSNTGSKGKTKAKRTTESAVASTTQDASVTEEDTEYCINWDMVLQ